MADLAALLDKEASAEIEAILSEARARASEIVAQARTDADALLAQRERAARQQYEAALVRAKSAAQLESASLKLKAQQAAIERVYSDAEAEINALVADDARYQPVLDALLREAMAGIGTKDVQVSVHPDDEALARKVVAKHGLAGDAVRTDASVRGGVRVRAVGSSTSVENGLYGRLASLREDLASEVAATLLRKEA